MNFSDLLKWLLEVMGINKKSTIWLLVIFLLANIGLYYSYPLINSLIAHLLILKILAHFCLSLLIISLFGNIVFLLSRPMLKVKLGVYWDTQFNPYCPKCKIPLTGSPAGNNVLRCAGCKEDFNLRYGAELLPLNVAIDKIKNKEV